jgi:hypothetical protein
MKSSSLQYVLLLLAGYLVSDAVARIQGSESLQPVTDTDFEEQPVLRAPLFLRKLRFGRTSKPGKQQTGKTEGANKRKPGGRGQQMGRGAGKREKAATGGERPERNNKPNKTGRGRQGKPEGAVQQAKKERTQELTLENIDKGRSSGMPEGMLVRATHVNKGASGGVTEGGQNAPSTKGRKGLKGIQKEKAKKANAKAERERENATAAKASKGSTEGSTEGSPEKSSKDEESREEEGETENVIGGGR